MSRSTIRTIVVVALATLVMGLTIPNIWVSPYVSNNAPININAHFDITSITPFAGLDAAHLHVGDHIDPRSLSVDERSWLIGWALPREDHTTVHMTVERNGRASNVVVPVPFSHSNQSFLSIALVKRLSASAFIVIAAILLLLRPSVMLWGFFFYAIGSAEGSPLILEWVGSTANTIGTLLLTCGIYDILGPLGLLLFATHFPVPASGGFRRRIQQLIPVLAALLVVPASTVALNFAAVALPPTLSITALFITNGITAVAIVALLVGFAGLDASQKQRLRWVVAGFMLYFATVVYQQIAAFLPSQGWPPAWTNAGWSADVLNGFVIFIPITVAYAVLKHHVLDINFVIGRGLVYGIVTSIAVAAFAVVEWVLGSVMAQTKLAAAGEVMAAIAIGFWLNGLHRQVDRFVDATIFRRRHLAERRLGQVAAGLPHAKSEAAVTSLIVREPVDALGLRSAAFFRRRDASGFHCDLAAGLPAAESAAIADDDALAVHLHGAQGPVYLHDIQWRPPFHVDPQNAPVIAFPIFVRHELQAIVLYGGHETGEAIDPDEVRVLESLCVGAAAALDHLEAVELRRRLEESERALAALKMAMAPS